MKILSGRRAQSLDEAIQLAFAEAGRPGMSPELAKLFNSALDAEKLTAESEKFITAALRDWFGCRVEWRGQRWLVALPLPGYDARTVPLLTISIQAYLVAALVAEMAREHDIVTLLGPLGKPDRLVLPISLLQAILDEELEKFHIVGKEGRYTYWDVPGLKEAVRLPTSFVTELSVALKVKSVSRWLLTFGSEGRSIAPMVVGSLLGLQFHNVLEPVPVGQQAFKREIVIAALTRLYGSARAIEMYEQAAPYLKANMTNDEVITFILKQEGRR